MSDERVSILHEQTDQLAEADEFEHRSPNEVVITFTDERTSDIPLIPGEWYWVVIGGESEQCCLLRTTHNPRLMCTTCYFER